MYDRKYKSFCFGPSRESNPRPRLTERGTYSRLQTQMPTNYHLRLPAVLNVNGY